MHFLLLALAFAAPPPAKIIRDSYGVPHIFGKADADVAWGITYAQAEDNFWQIEDETIRKLGRSAELRGPAGLMGDLMARLFETSVKAKEEYARAGGLKRSLCDAWAAGLNDYLARHPEVKPRLIARFEPWYLLIEGPPSGALVPARSIRAQYSSLGFPAGTADEPPPTPEGVEPDEGSNMWAIAPSHSASGKALLFLNPHVGFYGGGQRYEAVLESKQGLHVAGFAILGTPFIRSGFNANLGWSHTNNYAVTVSAYRETFDDPVNPLNYKYGAGYRAATEWDVEIPVRGANGMETRRARLRKTHHGPVIGSNGTSAITIRSGRRERDNDIEQRWMMARSRNLSEFRAAMSRATIFGSNTIYADRAGNIFYLHGNAIPRKDVKFDWSQPVDGSNPETEWQGFHDVSELPQAVNPKAGFLQNCNSTPFQMTAGGVDGGAPEAVKYPPYMAPEPQTPRADMSLRILGERAKFSYDDLLRAATDGRVLRAEKAIPELAAEWERSKPADTADAVALLQQWDRVTSIDSTAMTLFVYWQRERTPNLAALSTAMNALSRDFGTWKVAWGDVNRLQRVHTSGAEEPFSDARPSLPVRGGPPAMGIIFAFNTRTAPGQKLNYGISGNTYVAVVEFGKKPRARSILVYGESANPQSPHHFDQGEMYSRGEFKPVWFNRRELMKHLDRP